MKKVHFGAMLFLLIPLFLGALPGCLGSLNDSGSGDLKAAAGPLGMDVCYGCHTDPAASRDGGASFAGWLRSRHANFDTAGSIGDLDNRPDPFDSSLYSYSEITGNPGIVRSPFFNTDTACQPCHMSYFDAGDHPGYLLTLNAGGLLFPDPNPGEVERYLIDCEACHARGHFNNAEDATPAFDTCTGCHPPTDPMLSLAAFADAEHTDHHGPDSDRRWAYGDTTLNDLSGPDPILTTLVLGTETLDAYLVSAAWNTQGLPFLFQGDETINDTHYQGLWVTNVPNELVVYQVPTSRFGYVDLSNTSPNSGMVRADSPDACTASCHGAHDFDLTINRQWFAGAHHPNIEGPLGTESDWRGNVSITVSGPDNWGAVDYGFGAGCLRCHTANGFAEMGLAWGDAVKTPADRSDGFITCNACHDGANYPEPANGYALRHAGTVNLFDHRGGILRPVDAGSSAGCVYCHQGREDASHVAADVAAGEPQFRNMHYLPAGAMLFGAKGYEYPGQAYAGEHFHTLIASPCAACHMTDADPLSMDVGGHTFMIAANGEENIDLCQITCHGGMVGLDTFRGHSGDWDGDGNAGDPVRNEVDDLLSTTLAAIEAYDSPADADTAPNIYYQSWYPYFGTNSGQDWDGPLAAAAFNWQYVKKDPGAYAHNPRYAVQLLRDAYNDLRAADPSLPALGGQRP